MHKRPTGLIAALALLAAMAAAEEPQYFAIRNARIVPVSGPAIESGTVVIHDGLIAAVGKDVPIPPAARVIDGKGLIVYPGLIEALSTTLGFAEAAPAVTTATTTSRFGRTPTPTPTPPSTPATPATTEERPAQGPEDRPQTTPWVNAADLVSPSARNLEAARNAGFTSALVAPPRGIFTGYSAVINLAGERAGDMVVKTPVALHTTFGGAESFMSRSFPGSLFARMAYIRQTFLDLEHYQQEKAAYQKGSRGHKRPQYDRALEGLEPVASKRIPVFIAANTAVQILRYLDFGRELGVPFLLYGVQDGYRVAPELAKAKVAVLVSARWPEKERDADPEAEESLRLLRLRDRAPTTPAALLKAGVPFAFYSDGAGARDVIRNVKRSIDAGLPADAALRALTLAPAQIAGVADVLGSIEAGKIANLVVTDGDLFAEKTKVKYVFVDGEKFDIREEEARPEAAAGPPLVNVTGAWTLSVESPRGTETFTANLRQQGPALTGSVQSPLGTVEISDGSVGGNEVRFRISLNFGGRPVDVTVIGTVSGNSIKGTMGMGGGPAMSFTGSRPQEISDFGLRISDFEPATEPGEVK